MFFFFKLSYKLDGKIGGCSSVLKGDRWGWPGHRPDGTPSLTRRPNFARQQFFIYLASSAHRSLHATGWRQPICWKDEWRMGLAEVKISWAAMLAQYRIQTAMFFCTSGILTGWNASNKNKILVRFHYPLIVRREAQRWSMSSER